MKACCAEGKRQVACKLAALPHLRTKCCDRMAFGWCRGAGVRHSLPRGSTPAVLHYVLRPAWEHLGARVPPPITCHNPFLAPFGPSCSRSPRPVRAAALPAHAHTPDRPRPAAQGPRAVHAARPQPAGSAHRAAVAAAQVRHCCTTLRLRTIVIRTVLPRLIAPANRCVNISSWRALSYLTAAFPAHYLPTPHPPTRLAAPPALPCRTALYGTQVRRTARPGVAVAAHLPHGPGPEHPRPHGALGGPVGCTRGAPRPG